MKIALYQLKNQIGAIKSNAKRIMDFYDANSSSDLIITPECALSGYGICDDLFSFDFQESILNTIELIKSYTKGKNATLILGTPYFEDDRNTQGALTTKVYNTALVIQDGKIIEKIYKQKLPNYGVFNEYRYFSQKETVNVVEIKGFRVGIFVCEDMWHQDVIAKVVKQSPDFLVSINASIFEENKNKYRLQEIAKIAKEYKNQNKATVPIIYLNTIGGFDEIVFDGSSFVLNNYENIQAILENFDKNILKIQDSSLFFNPFVEQSETVNFSKGKFIFDIKQEIPLLWRCEREAIIYQALVFATKEFIHNCGFKGIVLGLSGGIDSALSVAIAVDSLGAQNVKALFMPSKYSGSLSCEIVNEIVKNFGIACQEIAIDNLVEEYKKSFENKIHYSKGTVLENLQARVRANLLMAFTNENSEYMLITTGNKSEIATGYSTIYGDTCGGFNIIKDLYKRDVFALVKWRNNNVFENFECKQKNILPQAVIDRKPSAELRDNQYDEDSLMDYNILDNILFAIVEEKQSLKELYSKFNKDLVDRVINLIKISHYKRHQGVVGVKISNRAFGRDFQYPISGSYKINDLK